MRFNFADGIKVTLASNVPFWSAVELDYSKQRVYRFRSLSSNYYDISSCDYKGKDMKATTRGPFDQRVLGVFRDSLYFLVTKNLYHINQTNISNGNISHRILVNQINYYDLIAVDSSVQPMGEL